MTQEELIYIIIFAIIYGLIIYWGEFLNRKNNVFWILKNWEKLTEEEKENFRIKNNL